MLQSRAIEEFHNEKWPAVVTRNFVNGANIRMVQRGRSARLASKSLQRLGIFRDGFGKKFYRNEPAEFHVLGLVNYAHTTAAQFFDDAVVRDGLSDHWRETARGGAY